MDVDCLTTPVTWTRLRRHVRKERNAKQRDRYRVVLLALGGKTEPEIRERTDRSRGFIQRWVYAYRDGGVEALIPRRPPGKPPRLSAAQQQEFLALLARPDAPRRGVDIQALLADHFGVTYSLRGAVVLLHRLGYEPLQPRPVNPKKDAEEEAVWKQAAPLLSGFSGSSTPNRDVEVWLQDECRFGQKGCLSHVWAPKGSRPVVPLQNEYEWVYLYGAVNPQTGESCARVLPWVNTEMMQIHLDAISEQVGPKRHVVLVLDNAGWHGSSRLELPDNISLLPLPPYSPELNPIERLWHWLKDHEFSNRVYPDYDDLLEAVSDMWNTLTRERIQSVCSCSWTHEC